jgi:hypothetical protein
MCHLLFRIQRLICDGVLRQRITFSIPETAAREFVVVLMVLDQHFAVERAEGHHEDSLVSLECWKREA